MLYKILAQTNQQLEVYLTYIKHTILGGSARSAALPFLVRLITALLKILCFNKSIAPLPLPVFPESCIGEEIY